VRSESKLDERSRHPPLLFFILFHPSLGLRSSSSPLILHSLPSTISSRFQRALHLHPSTLLPSLSSIRPDLLPDHPSPSPHLFPSSSLPPYHRTDSPSLSSLSLFPLSTPETMEGVRSVFPPSLSSLLPSFIRAHTLPSFPSLLFSLFQHPTQIRRGR